jgi:arylsulfatase A-like enzyme
LITDEPSIADLPWAVALDDVIHVPRERSAETAPSLEETQLARFFAVASEWLQETTEPFCLFAHCGSLGEVWDAPYEYRKRYADEDEPPPPHSATPPACTLAEDYDPDELLGYCQSYAGQATALDACLAALIAQLDQLPAHKQTLLIVISPRGFPLGEHRHVGAVGMPPHAELVHIPWMVRLPDGQGASDRSSALVQPCDLAPTLAEWFGVAGVPASVLHGQSLLPIIRSEATPVRDRALVAAGRWRAIRTPAWFLIAEQPSDADTPSAAPPTFRLFAKPDDRWELNDVADRCQAVVELLAPLVAAPASGEPAAPLPEILLIGLE